MPRVKGPVIFFAIIISIGSATTQAGQPAAVASSAEVKGTRRKATFQFMAAGGVILICMHRLLAARRP